MAVLALEMNEQKPKLSICRLKVQICTMTGVKNDRTNKFLFVFFTRSVTEGLWTCLVTENFSELFFSLSL